MRFLPDFYREGAAYEESVRLLESRDHGAVAAIIALTRTDGHYFSEDFWESISKAAAGLDMQGEVLYCKEQIARNKSDIGWGTPHGWTTVKLGPTKYKHHIAKLLVDRWDNERRKRDGVDRLLMENGFHVVWGHRECGTIYHVENGRLIEIQVEHSDGHKYDVWIDFNAVTHSALPEKTLLSAEERSQLKEELLAWLEATKTVSNL